MFEEQAKEYFVLPEKEKHVNLHNYCLHLFYSAENPLPDFTGGTGSRNAGKRTGRRLGGYERRRRIKKRIDKKTAIYCHYGAQFCK